MKIVHRVTINADADVAKALADLGVIIGKGLSTFVVDEADPKWPKIERIIVDHRAVDIISTKFTTAELDSAGSVQVKSTWHWSYPQPEHGYLETTYDSSDYCSECGIGAKQIAPFRMLSEPPWGDKSILQLNWMFDEFFVRRDLWAEVLLPLGVEARLVVNHQSGLPLSGVVQCDIKTIASSNLDIGDHHYRHCTKCERRKYLPFTRGCFPRFQSEVQNAPIIKSKEYFGVGAKAFRAVIVSHTVYAAITKSRLRGCSFTPVCK